MFNKYFILLLLFVGLLASCNKEVTPDVIAEFTTDKTAINVGESISFTDESSSSPSTWQWTFEGGDPATSTLQNPTVSYKKAGTFAVTLVAGDSRGNNTIEKQSLITVTWDGQVSYYTMDGNANDASGNGLSGTIVGSVTSTTDRNGDANKALYFPGGSNYISLGDKTQFDFKAGFSVSMWVNYGYVGEGKNLPTYVTLFAQEGDILLSKQPNSLREAVFAGNQNSWSWFNANQDLSVSQWHHIVLTYGNQSTKIYKDGVVISNRETSGNMKDNNVNDNTIYLGIRNQTNRPFVGKMDDVRIFNRALSSNEVSWLKDE